jgi:hypothetical protein
MHVWIVLFPCAICGKKQEWRDAERRRVLGVCNGCARRKMEPGTCSPWPRVRAPATATEE